MLYAKTCPHFRCSVNWNNFYWRLRVALGFPFPPTEFTSPTSIAMIKILRYKITTILFSIIFTIGVCISISHAGTSQNHRTVAANKALDQLTKERNLSPPDILPQIKQNRFQEVESIANRYAKKSKHNLALERYHLELFESVGKDPTNGVEDALNKWVSQSPSENAYGARGFYRMNRGLSIRGYNSINQTSPKNIEAMRHYFNLAKLDLKKAIEINREFIPGYYALIYMETTSGSREITQEIYKQAIKISPNSFQIRNIYLHSLKPRWGGSYAEMQSYINTLDKPIQNNPLIWTLKGNLFDEMGHQARLDGDDELALKLYTKALAYGDRVSFLKGMAQVNRSLKKFETALTYYKKCLIQNSREEDCIDGEKQLTQYLKELEIWKNQTNIKRSN